MNQSSRSVRGTGRGFQGRSVINRVVVRPDGLIYAGHEADGKTEIWRSDAASIFDLSYPNHRAEADALCAKHGAKLKRWSEAMKR